jgi:hypothetical protein
VNAGVYVHKDAGHIHSVRQKANASRLPGWSAGLDDCRTRCCAGRS